MWGNKLGWGLSLLIVGFVGTMMWALSKLGSAITQPTPIFMAALPRIDPIKLPVAPESLLAMDDPSDAGPYYQQAIAEYHKGRNVYRKFNYRLPGSGTALPAVEFLVKGTHCKTMDLYGSHPEKIANYGADRLELEDVTILKEIAKIAFLQGLVNLAGADKDKDGNKIPANPAEAKRLYEAVFALGVHLYNERVMYEELMRAEGLMSEGADALKGLATRENDTARAQQCEDFKQAYLNYDASCIKPTWNFISTLNSSVVAENVGNVFYLASQAQDRMWRVEAILTVGEYKFASVKPADRRWAIAALAKWAQEDTDPAVRSAAIAARDFDEGDFRIQRGREPH